MANEEKKARNQEKRAKKKAALQLVLNFVKEGTEDQGLLSAVAILTPGQRFGGTVRTGIKDVVAELFLEKKAVLEMDLFTELKLGRAEMRSISKKLIRNNKPEERMWIHFDPQEGMYTLVHTGADTPKDWTGYTPINAEEMDIV